MKRTAAFTVLCILLMSLLVGGSGGRAEGLRVQAGVDAANVPNASPDWTAESDQANAQFGTWVGTAGDVNGDGVADVIVGAPAYDGDQTDEGRAYVYHGAIIGLGTRPVWTVEGDQLNARMGSVSTAGDVNGDGFADVIVGASAYDGGETNEGRVYVYHGSARGLSPTPNWSAESDQDGAEFGHSVRTAGDVNGDGYADVIVGAPRYDQDRGRAYLYHGSPSGLSLFPNWMVEGDQLGALFGWSVGTAGDVNGDGFDDVIVTAMWYSNPEGWEGCVYGYYGSVFGLSSTPNWMVESNRGFAHFGYSASAAGDVNGDGYDDVIIGAPSYYDWYDGRVFVYHGSATGLSTTPNWTARDDQEDTDFGLSVASAGDVNDDGFADVIIGAWGYDNGQIDEGRVYLYYGSATGLRANPAWSAESDQPGAHLGAWVGAAGDVNGDSVADVIVGAPTYDGGQTDEGRAYVYHSWVSPVVRQIAAGTDDTCIRMETEENRVDWQFIRLGKSAYTYLCGFRFTGVAIPRGARILGATLSFHPTGWSTGVPVAFTLYGEATDHAADFSSRNPPAHLRPRTQASVPWTLSTVPTTWFDTPDLAPLIQEIVNRPGWQAGNALSLLVDAAATNRYYVDAWAYDGRPTLAARLRVRYESPPPPPNVWYGSITADTVWRAAQSPYYVDGDLTIEQGATLTIEPGVVVRIFPDDRLASGVDPEKVELIVKGTLVADGEPDRPITFTSTVSGQLRGHWYGIRFTDASTDWGSSGCILDHAVIRYASVGIATDAASPMLSHNVITDISGDDGQEEGETAYGIYIANGSRPFVIGNLIQRVEGGSGVTVGGHGVGIAVMRATPVIVGNTLSAITGTDAGGDMGPYYIVGCGGWGMGIHVTQSPTFLIADNVITDIAGAYGGLMWERTCSLGVGIYLDGASPDIVGNRLTNIQGGDGASQADDSSAPGSHGIGIVVTADSAPHIHDNLINGIRGGEGGTRTAYQASPGGLGVGIDVQDSSPVIAHNTISAVYGGRGGDGYYNARGGNGGTAVGIYGRNAAFPVFDNLIFDIVGGEGDDAEEGGGNGGHGIGVYAEGHASLEITSNTIANTDGGRGGTYGGTDGLGIGLDAPTWAAVVNNIIVGHTYGIRCSAPPCPAPSYNNVWGNATHYVGVAAGPHDISANPLFITGPDGYYYLRQTPPDLWGDSSPCVDAGSDTAARLGLAHRSTRTDGMPDTGRVDLGYHRRATPPHVAWLPWMVRE